MNSVKFISQCRNHTFKDRLRISRLVLNYLKSRFFYTSTTNKCVEILKDENFLKKVIYNEVLLEKRFKNESDETETKHICLKYLMQDKKQNDPTEVPDPEIKKEIVHFPYEVKSQNDENNAVYSFSESVNIFTPSDVDKINVPKWSVDNYLSRFGSVEKPRRWAFEEEIMQEKNEFEDVFKFGSYNANMRISSVPCGGCGALLHCNNPTLPGFIPAELFENKSRTELLGEKCQRCHFLEKFQVPLGINVSPSEYEKLICSLKDQNALVIIMIDILDFPCSIFPKIFDLIGPRKPIVIVANKVDLLIQEDSWCHQNFKKSLMRTLQKHKLNIENIKHVALISAKTGYGVENLIDVLHSNWGNKGDIYLIGCTNVGKSSLFNTLIQSDFCKVKAINLLQRATVSPWPGTTLNLLKFPILNPRKWRLMMRSRRLASQIKEEYAFKKYQCLGRNIQLEQIPLHGYVGRTFLNKENIDSTNESEDTPVDKPKGMDPHIQEFAKGYWFYDTPGVVNQDQIVNFLTAPELLLTVPKKMLLPRNFHLKPGSSLFIAGLARLDYVSGPDYVWFTVYASMELPITVTKIKDAEYVYQKLLGTPYFRVPVEGKQRLAMWPELSSKKFEIEGKLTKFLPQKINPNDKLLKETDADIVLSSAGWVAVTVPPAYLCKVEGWTPKGKGIYLRDIPLIKRGFTFKGSKIPGTPAYRTIMKEIEKPSLTEEPSF